MLKSIKDLTIMVPNKVKYSFFNKSLYFPLIVCFKHKIICMLGHFDPKNAYLELADHPANSIPYVAKEDIANRYNIPIL